MSIEPRNIDFFKSKKKKTDNYNIILSVKNNKLYCQMVLNNDMNNQILKVFSNEEKKNDKKIELLCIKDCLSYINNNTDDCSKNINIYTMSYYIRDCLTEWIHEWIKDDSLNSSRPNSELLTEIYPLIHQNKHWKIHIDVPFNKSFLEVYYSKKFVKFMNEN
jgi:hypothetical protein